MNKRIIRMIIYEGDEELVDAYERNALKETRLSYGFPSHWNEEKQTGKQIIITGGTLTDEDGLFQIIEKHNLQTQRIMSNKGIELELNKNLAEPILNQLNK